MNKEELNDLMDSLSAILIRCFFLTVVFLLLSFIFYLLSGDMVYRLHSKWFELSKHDYDLLYYGGMAFIKICAIIFFLFPYFAIRMVVRKNIKEA
jgi:hypothetical protein